MRPALQRLLWVVGTSGAFVLLIALGLGLASLFAPGDSRAPDPEPPRPAPAPSPEPPPPAPPPAPVQQPAAAPAPPPPVPAPVIPEPPLRPGVLPLNTKLRLRREIVLGLTDLKNELVRCPSEAVQRTAPGGRATLVLEAIGTGNAVQVTSSTLEADVPVNDRFVSCARGIIDGRTFPASGAAAGVHLRFFIPLGPGGNSLSRPSASLVEAEASR